MSEDASTPPNSDRKPPQPPRQRAARDGAGGADERAPRSVSEVGADAVQRSLASIAESARVAAGRHAQGVLGTALQDASVSGRLVKQIEAIGKRVAGQAGKGWAEGLKHSQAADVVRVAGLSPSINKRMQETVASTGLAQARLPMLADTERIKAVRQGIARQLTVTNGVGLAEQWTGRHLKAITAFQETLTRATRFQRMMAEVTTPLEDMARIGLLAAAANRQLMRSPLAAKGLFMGDRLASILGESRALAGLAEAVTAPLAKHIASLGAITAPNRLLDAFEREREIDAAIERAAKRWEASALWFLLSILSVGQLAALARLERADVEAVLLDALEAVVVSGAYTAALMGTLTKAPYVSADQRDDLLHGLEHAQRGEFSRAALPLTAGLEGALWSAGRELAVIDDERRLLDRPGKGVIHRVEHVVRKLPAMQEFRTFVCSGVFGDKGNPLRHGAHSDRRRQALFAIAAIAGWIETFMKVAAADALGSALSHELASRRLPPAFR